MHDLRSMMKYVSLVLIFISSCGLVGKGPYLIQDDTSCKYTFYYNEETHIKKTVIKVHQECKKGEWMDYFFDRDSSVWKENGILVKRRFSYRLVYDTNYTIKVTNAEIELFKDVKRKADSLGIQNFNNLDKAKGFLKMVSDNN